VRCCLLWLKSPTLGQIARFWRSFSFASIGIVNVLVDVTCFTISFQLLHLSLIASNMIAWLIAVTGSNAMNTKITFGLQTGGALSVRRYLSFATSGVIGVIVSTIILVALSRYTNVPRPNSLSLPDSV
jgi:putative flippase GtrA